MTVRSSSLRSRVGPQSQSCQKPTSRSHARLLSLTQLGHREGQRQSVNKYGVGSELWPEPFPEQPKRWTLTPLHIRDFTNRRGSDVDSPIRHANPDQRTHTQEVPHRRAVPHKRAVPHRPDIHQPPLAAALQ
jgi:hypothetical protein